MPKKIHLITNGLRDTNAVRKDHKNRLRKQYHINWDEIILLSVGRLDISKGLHPLLSCFKKIVDRYNNCRLVLVGDGDYSILQNHTRIMSKVIVTDRISKEDVNKWYSMADIGIFSSYAEQCSYVGIEMMMHGLPIVASDSYGVRNMFNDRENALVAKRNSYKNNRIFEKNLFDSLSQLIESKTLREQLALGGRKTYEEKYNIDTMRENYKRLLELIDTR